MIGGLAALPFASVGAATLPKLTIYSPAPPATPLHALNLQLVEVLAGVAAVDMPAVALPQSVNDVAGLSKTERAWRWPIVTTPDFAAARSGAGPDWHGYPRACPDLKFVASLYDVGFGIQPLMPGIAKPADLAGKRIAVPARPSAVRWLSEVLLRDGWGMLDDVTLVELPPGGVMAARAAGRIDAAAWNLVLPGGPMLPLAGPYLDVDDAALARINAANPFTLDRTPHGGARLLSFRQGLAAWDESDPALVTAALRRLREHAGRSAGLPRDVADMRRWPALDEAALHPAAAAFYRSAR